MISSWAGCANCCCCITFFYIRGAGLIVFCSQSSSICQWPAAIKEQLAAEAPLMPCTTDRQPTHLSFLFRDLYWSFPPNRFEPLLAWDGVFPTASVQYTFHWAGRKCMSRVLKSFIAAIPCIVLYWTWTRFSLHIVNPLILWLCVFDLLQPGIGV